MHEGRERAYSAPCPGQQLELERVCKERKLLFQGQPFGGSKARRSSQREAGKQSGCPEHPARRSPAPALWTERQRGLVARAQGWGQGAGGRMGGIHKDGLLNGESRRAELPAQLCPVAFGKAQAPSRAVLSNTFCSRTLSPTAVPTGTRGALLSAGISWCCCYPSWNTSTEWHAGERFLRSRQGRCRVTRVPATRGDFPMAQAGGAAFRPCRCPRRAASPPQPQSPRVPRTSGRVRTAPRQRLAPEQR